MPPHETRLRLQRLYNLLDAVLTIKFNQGSNELSKEVRKRLDAIPVYTIQGFIEAQIIGELEKLAAEQVIETSLEKQRESNKVVAE